MCGVLIAFHRQGLSRFGGNIEFALDSIRHRGPDQAGEWRNESWYVGSTRLAVTGGTKNLQPRVTRDKRFVIVFNGEIYNFRKLRKQLIDKGWDFDTDGDTEVIVNSYLEWGENCFKLFDGQYVIAILDVLTNELVVARDRFGEKPAYFQLTPMSLVVSSEVNPIIQIHQTPVEINRTSVLQYLLNWYVQEPNTIFRNIYAIPPNTYTRINVLNSFQTEQPEFIEIHKEELTREYFEVKQNNIVDDFEEYLTQAILLTYPLEHEPALMLSGGLDSSLIACILRKEGLPFKAFSTTLQGKAMDESNMVENIATNLGISVTKIPIVAPDSHDLRRIISQTDIPIGEASFIAGFESAKIIKDFGYKVALLGDGGDEILAGYPTYLATILSSKIPTRVKPIMRQLGLVLNRLPFEINHNETKDKILRFLLFQNQDSKLSHLSWRVNCTFADLHMRNNLTSNSAIEEYNYTMKQLVKGDSGNLLMSIMKLDRKTWLSSSNLVKNDRAFMLHGIENRTPYLTNLLVDYADTLPNNLKMRGLRTKCLSRELSKRYLGNLLSSDSKKGWSFPLKEWTSLIDDETDQLMKNSVILEFFPELEEVFHQRQIGIKGSHRFKWAMITLEYWLQTRTYPIY